VEKEGGKRDETRRERHTVLKGGQGPPLGGGENGRKDAPLDGKKRTLGREKQGKNQRSKGKCLP